MCRRNCVPKPAPSLRAFDQPGNIRHHEAELLRRFAHHHDAEVRLQRGERIVGDLRPRRRDARDQRALAGVGISHQPNVGQQLQLQPQRALFAGKSLLMLARSLVRRGRKPRVAASAASAVRDHDALIRAARSRAPARRSARRTRSFPPGPSAPRRRLRGRCSSSPRRGVRARPCIRD